MAIAWLVTISQQFVNISNGMPLQNVTAQDNLPFKPHASATRVNALWFLSLVFCLTCALSATLVQQGQHQHLVFAQARGVAFNYPRMRAYIRNGLKWFGTPRTVEGIATLLRISVFLFFVGLIEFLLHIDRAVASALSATLQRSLLRTLY